MYLLPLFSTSCLFVLITTSINAITQTLLKLVVWVVEIFSVKCNVLWPECQVLLIRPYLLFSLHLEMLFGINRTYLLGKYDHSSGLHQCMCALAQGPGVKDKAGSP